MPNPQPNRKADEGQRPTEKETTENQSAETPTPRFFVPRVRCYRPSSVLHGPFPSTRRSPEVYVHPSPRGPRLEPQNRTNIIIIDLDFSQRHRYFSLYDKGCLLDRVGWYSVTPELIADRIAERCRCDTVVDAFCGVGGNAIAFAKTCRRVIAIENDETRLRLARHNAAIYGVADRIEFILGDFIQFAKTLAEREETGRTGRAVDVVFLSPPWGGPSYLHGSDPDLPSDPSERPEFSLSDITPIPGSELFKLVRRLTPNIAYYLPRNTNLQEVSDLLTDAEGGGVEGKDKDRKVEVEEQRMRGKLKVLTCYFGGLARGQEHLF